jgi:hypothetical protein
MRKYIALSVLGLLVLALLGVSSCDPGSFSVNTVTLGIAGRSAGPDGVYDLQEGLDYRLTWEVRSPNGNLLDREFDDFTWGVSNTSVVRINTSAEELEARNQGFATVTAILRSSNVTGSVQVRVN